MIDPTEDEQWKIRGALLCYRVRAILDPSRHALEVTIEPR